MSDRDQQPRTVQREQDGTSASPAEMEPPGLPLVEEVVLLALAAPHDAVQRAARIGGQAYPDGPQDRAMAVAALERNGLAERQGALRHLKPTQKADVRRRIDRAHRLIATASRMSDPEAELLVLLAVARALPINSHGDDHLRARLRLHDALSMKPRPAALDGVVEKLGAGSVPDLVDKLLAPEMFPLADHGPSTPILYGAAFGNS